MCIVFSSKSSSSCARFSFRALSLGYARITDEEAWEKSRLSREKTPKRLLVQPDLAEFAA
ncbi:MAG TPA: hypothetical protein VFW73_10205 [Lacipirellulaceae bacterium]|nr:hypothetical protein [Lacipirellulaceae bacterium]